MIIDGTEEEVRLLGGILKQLKEKLPNMEFLVSNDKLQLHSIDYLIKELKGMQDKQIKFKKEMLEAKKNESS
jgi:hypothetical protein